MTDRRATEPPSRRAAESCTGIGLMSGTSLDGMDAALVRFHGPTRAELIAFAHRPYHPEERRELEEAMEKQVAGARRLAHLHAHLGHWAADAVEAVLERAGTRATEVDFIAFHGQTVWHEPPLVTFQLGEPALLAERFGVRVVSGFRGRDLAAGGEGAPLVPLADVLLFGAEEGPRVLLNIGGMANLTWVPRRAVEDGAIAFDTGPGMAVIDAAARLVDPSLSCDLEGTLAARERPDEALLAELLDDPFFHEPPPKSTGRERFGNAYAARLYSRLGAGAVATAVELTARTIAAAVERWTPPTGEVVASGGGCRHPVLWEALGERLRAQGRALRLFEEIFFPGEAKEAVAFALLGYLTIHGQPGNLPAATGARGRRVLGAVTPA